jgi:hypothetical protein
LIAGSLSAFFFKRPDRLERGSDPLQRFHATLLYKKLYAASDLVDKFVDAKTSVFNRFQ